MIEAMDRQVGRVIKALDANGLTENTIVIFTSDNGGERFADTWPFTGKKTELLEGGLRIPALIAGPPAFLRAARQTRFPSAWTGCLRCLQQPAPCPIPPILSMASISFHFSRATRARSAQIVLALQGERTAGSTRRRLQVPQDSRQYVSLQRGRRSVGARQP